MARINWCNTLINVGKMNSSSIILLTSFSRAAKAMFFDDMFH